MHSRNRPQPAQETSSLPAASTSKDPARNRPAVLVASHLMVRSSSDRSAASTTRTPRKANSSAEEEFRREAEQGVAGVRHSSLPTIRDTSPLATAPVEASRNTQSKMIRTGSGWRKDDSEETLYQRPEASKAVVCAPTGRTRGQLVCTGLKWGSWKLLRLGLKGYGLDLRWGNSIKPTKAAAQEPAPEAAPAPAPTTAGAEQKVRKAAKAPVCPSAARISK